MSLSEARRFADAPFALMLATDARVMKAAKALIASDDPADSMRRARVCNEQVRRIAERPTRY